MPKYDDFIEDGGLIKVQGWARQGLTNEQIAKKIDIVMSTFYRWKIEHKEFSDALKKGKEVVDFEVENALLKRALGYKYEEVTWERIQNPDLQDKRHGVKQKLTDEEWETCKAFFGNRCAYCGEDTSLTKDHLQAMAEGGLLTASNVVPSCQRCNSSKGKKKWDFWYRKQPFYSEEKEMRIKDYINFVSAREKNKECEEGNLVITKKVEKHVNPDVTAIIFWLKNRMKNEWRTNPTPDGEESLQALDAVLDRIKSAF